MHMLDKGKLIRLYRKKLGWTQQSLANVVNTSVSTISRIELGKYDPSRELLSRIQETLQIEEFTAQEDQPLSNKLHSWHRSISQGNYTTAQKYYNELREVPAPYFYENKGLHVLCHFLYALIRHRTDIATKHVTDVQHYIETQTTTHTFPFQKALSLYYLEIHHINYALCYLNVASKLHPEKSAIDGDIHLYYALAYEEIGNYQDSNSYADTALKLYQSSMNLPSALLSNILLLKNAIYSMQQSNTIIIEKLHHILAHYTSIYTSYIHYVLSLAYFENNDVDNALKYNKKAIANEKNPLQKAKYILFTSYLYAIQKKPDLALTYINSANKLNKQKKYTYYCYLLEGILLQIHGTDNYRTKISEEILPYFQTTGDRTAQNYCHAILGNVSQQLHIYKEASAHYLCVDANNTHFMRLLTIYPKK
ncbi:helix-turn-helix transcriptional regulator [Gracilibacillus sp. S3-1-1]|uniref:Helix-turn-helix transcriptional regulator n=1 Tax=Gracilibacillus pellucidus TaxID=3095368 RepID=A0ACC6M7Z3_9BACI|nr:helix-turn-helix transcriptional regulator [Gracilibacillus sp. S3-1-1]MDX8047110.1 helix-turn-helix transcriptional regulator [Gracilibacillus sp. S3-1-1]